MVRILILMLVPFVCFSQITPREDISYNNVLKEKEDLDAKRKASYNLDEIKVRWKKSALENCPGVPCVTNTVPGAPTDVVATGGIGSANVSFTAPTNNGGSAITVYTVTSSPGAISATGATSPINVTGLTNGTSYTFTVIATNAIGNSVVSTASTGVTPVAPPACGSITSVSDVDGNPYETVSIGTQCWMKSNLKVTRYNDGTVIGDSTLSTWGTAAIGARTEYIGFGTIPVGGYVGTYGYLYNWYAAKGIYTTGVMTSTDTLNICPLSWHVPTKDEMATLLTYLGGPTMAGGKMKSIGTAYWSSVNTGATNESGFSALPGGERTSSMGFFAYFWTSTVSEVTPLNIYQLQLLNGLASVSFLPNGQRNGGSASIRCLKD